MHLGPDLHPQDHPGLGDRPRLLRSVRMPEPGGTVDPATGSVRREMAVRYKGRPELKIEGGILRPRVERLLVGRRDCTKLGDGLLKQITLVREAVPVS